jgi:hypothetical protein
MTKARGRQSRPWSRPTAAFAVTLASIMIAWLANSISAQLDNLERPGAVQTTPPPPLSGNLYRLSPVPPGADWAS